MLYMSLLGCMMSENAKLALLSYNSSKELIFLLFCHYLIFLVQFRQIMSLSGCGVNL